MADQAAYCHRQGLLLAVAALKPETGNRAPYVVRELQCGLVWHGTPVLSAGPQTLERPVLEPVNALGSRIRGGVSDDEPALQVAVAQVFPGIRQQTCQSHCLREAATPLGEAERACKKALKQALRAPF